MRAMTLSEVGVDRHIQENVGMPLLVNCMMGT